MPIVRHKENLKFEGQFTPSTRQDQKWVPGDRAPIVKRTDNLKPSEGVFEKRQVETWAPGDRSDIVGKKNSFSNTLQIYSLVFLCFCFLTAILLQTFAVSMDTLGLKTFT